MTPPTTTKPVPPYADLDEVQVITRLVEGEHQVVLRLKTPFWKADKFYPVSLCTKCAALVGDQDAHTAYHAQGIGGGTET